MTSGGRVDSSSCPGRLEEPEAKSDPRPGRADRLPFCAIQGGGMYLREVELGSVAAENDIDHGLADYFVDTESYRRVESGHKTIILGNRGTGKSAIFKVLAARERLNGTAVLELTPEDYSYEMLSGVMRPESEGAWAKHGAYAAAWKYLLLVSVMKEATRKGRKLKSGRVSEIYKYLRDHHSGFQSNPMDVLISYVKRFEGVKVGKYEAGFKARELQRLYGLEEVADLLEPLKVLLHERPAAVFVDELDRGWDGSEDAQSFVAGLFQACSWLNGLSPDLRVYVSLRQELYHSIPALYEDAQKYRDVMEIIRWDEASLLELIARRIKYSVEELRDVGDEHAWTAIFSETLDYRRARSFNYIVDRTLYRPREVIQFCGESVDQAVDRASDLVNYQDISRAEASYGRSRIDDISAEYRFQYPGLSKIFEAFRGKTYTFDRDELELLCLEIVEGDYPLPEEARWVESQSHDLLIEILWQVGFLRAWVVGGIKGVRRSGSQYLGPHQISNLNLMQIPRFQVHQMFRVPLGLKEPKGED